MAGIVRISDKYRRLVNLTNNENRVLESKADTLKDMANYCLMLAVWLEGEKVEQMTIYDFLEEL